ncbi:MAG: helix-turn-helix transcriptional regulator [Pseudomonadota bacterium]
MRVRGEETMIDAAKDPAAFFADLVAVGGVVDTQADGLGWGGLAAQVGVAPAHLSRAFKAATGRTPRQHLIARRLAHATRMLAEGREPLAEIAYACGFSSQSHMTALFSEHIGMPPGRYRKEATR